MKRFFVITSCIMLGQAILAQNDNTQIAGIEKTKQYINNNIVNFKQIEALKGNTGGYRNAYARGKELQLVTFCAKDQSISKYVEWYFYNGHMIYAEQNWINDTTGVVIDNEKFYLNASHPIAWIQADNTAVDTTTPQFKSMATQLQAYEKTLQDRYTAMINDGNK